MTANFILMGLVFLLGIAISILILLFMDSDILSSGSQLIRILIGVGVSLLYIFGFINLGLLVSSLSKSSVSAIVSLMFCWVVLFMIYPKGSVIISKLVKPVNSQEVIDQEKNQARLQIENEERIEAQKLKDTVPELKGMDTDEFFNKLFKGDKLAKAFEKKQNELKTSFKERCESELNKIDSYYEGQRNSQALLAQNISRLSPVSCFVHAIVELSNTGLLEYEQWKVTRSRFKRAS